MKINSKRSPSNHDRHNSNITHSRHSLSSHRPSLTSLTDRLSSHHSDSEHVDHHISSPLASEHLIHRPISLSILEKYFSDICQCITNKEFVDPALLAKSETMKEVLKDCLAAINNLSLEIYILMSSSLKDIHYIYTTSDTRIFPMLLNKLLQISILIEDNKYRSSTEPAFQGFGEEEEKTKDLWLELDIRISRVTARVLNIWKKIVSPQKDAGIICCCFLLLYCEVDKSIKVSPWLRLKFDKAVNVMKEYSANPGYVVTVIRKTREYIEKEMIGPEVIKRINEALMKITPESVRNMDKTFTGLVIYEMILYAVKYYRSFYEKKYGIDVLEKTQKDSHLPVDLYEKKNGISQSENFGIILSVDSPRNKKSPKKSVSPKKPVLIIPQFHKDLSRSSSRSLTARVPSRSSEGLYRVSPMKTPQKIRNSPLVRNTNRSFPEKVKKIETRSEKVVKNEKNLTVEGKKSNFKGSDSVDHSDLLEEMQYQQFIEEKFRNFLIGKLNGFDKEESLEAKIRSEEKVIKNRAEWMNEFENKVGVIRFNAVKKLSDERRFMAELIRAQKQLEIMESKIKIK